VRAVRGLRDSHLVVQGPTRHRQDLGDCTRHFGRRSGWRARQASRPTRTKRSTTSSLRWSAQPSRSASPSRA
jgi:hypothetical protein